MIDRFGLVLMFEVSLRNLTASPIVSGKSHAGGWGKPRGYRSVI